MSFIICTNLMNALTFMYPVGYLESEEIILYVRHDSQGESLIMIPHPSRTIKEARTLAIPFSSQLSHITLFADKSGFSYFDAGIFKKKRFNKRSAGSIFCERPFDHAMGIYWYSDQCAVLSLLDPNTSSRIHYNLFVFDQISGQTKCVRKFEEGDCFFPFMDGETLFYLKRDRDSTFSIEKGTLYDQLSDKVIFQSKEPIITFEMIDATKGIFSLLAHQNADELVINFYKIEKKEDKEWQKTFLLSYKLPTSSVKDPEFQEHFPFCIKPLIVDTTLYYITINSDSINQAYL
jgi:hypothetical protein